MVYAKTPFAGPETVLTNLSRYTRRVAISNSRYFAVQTVDGVRVVQLNHLSALNWSAPLDG